MSSFFLWNSQGLIPGPEDSEESFNQKCQKTISKHPHSPVSYLAKKMFDIDPQWVEIKYSNQGLRFWEGACTWIEENQVTLQLPKTLENKEKYLGLYSKEELIAHELVHVARRGFEEPMFEEILAYQTSASTFRRFFGPLFRTSKETLYTLFILVACLLSATFSSFPLAGYLGLLLLSGFGLIRLFRTQKIFSRARQNLVKTVGEDKALYIMLRLTDREIICFSKMEAKEILDYAKKMARVHFRWKYIWDIYFFSQNDQSQFSYFQ